MFAKAGQPGVQGAAGGAGDGGGVGGGLTELYKQWVYFICVSQMWFGPHGRRLAEDFQPSSPLNCHRGLKLNSSPFTLLAVLPSLFRSKPKEPPISSHHVAADDSKSPSTQYSFSEDIIHSQVSDCAHFLADSDTSASLN